MIKCENDGSSYGIQGAFRVLSVVLFQASNHRGHPALMELYGELGDGISRSGAVHKLSVNKSVRCSQLHSMRSS